jgi:hypothetical protein
MKYVSRHRLGCKKVWKDLFPGAIAIRKKLPSAAALRE